MSLLPASRDVDARQSTFNYVEGHQYNIIVAEQLKDAGPQKLGLLANQLVERNIAPQRQTANLSGLYRTGNLKALRGAIWTSLHKEPYIILQEDFLTNAAGEDQENSQNWLGGTYTFTYPTSHNLALICVNIDWNAFVDPHKPSLRWSIDTPESLYHPGRHRGQLYIKKIEKSIFESKFGVTWESPIFSPFITPRGDLSSEGPLEECPTFVGFTDIMMSLAHFVAFGPYDDRGDFPKAPFSFHSEMGGTASRFFAAAERDAFARVSSFFARAFTLKVPDEDQFIGKGFSNECRETSVVAIQELLQFYCPKLLKETSTNNDDWDFQTAFANVASHRDWAIEEKKWAAKLADICGLGFLRISIKAMESDDGEDISAGAAAAAVAAKSQQTKENVPVAPENVPDVPAEVQSASVPVVPLEKAKEETPLVIAPSWDTWVKEDKPPGDWTPLHCAVWRHDIKEVSSLASSRTVRAQDCFGWTPLHLACSSSGSFLFRTRQLSGREIKSLRMPFGWARGRIRDYSDDGNEEITSMAAVEILLSKGASPNTKGIDHATPLHCAASSGWTRAAKALLSAGAEVYTGPTCSPICWAIDGSGGKHPTTVLLRERLGSDGWQKIVDDHERVAQQRAASGKHNPS